MFKNFKPTAKGTCQECLPHIDTKVYGVNLSVKGKLPTNLTLGVGQAIIVILDLDRSDLF